MQIHPIGMHSAKPTPKPAREKSSLAFPGVKASTRLLSSTPSLGRSEAQVVVSERAGDSKSEGIGD